MRIKNCQVFSNGFVVAFGSHIAYASESTTITYPIALNNPAYCINVSFGTEAYSFISYTPFAATSSTTGFIIYSGNWQSANPQVTRYWSCMGV